MRHKMTFSHFSKDLIRPNLGEESRCVCYQVSGFQVSHAHPLCPPKLGGEEGL